MYMDIFQERQRGGASVSYWDVFTHTHALSQVDEAGTVSYSWDHDAKAQSAYVSNIMT